MSEDSHDTKLSSRSLLPCYHAQCICTSLDFHRRMRIPPQIFRHFLRADFERRAARRWLAEAKCPPALPRPDLLPLFLLPINLVPFYREYLFFFFSATRNLLYWH